MKWKKSLYHAGWFAFDPASRPWNIEVAKAGDARWALTVGREQIATDDDPLELMAVAARTVTARAAA
jgi:hypothetical protein